MSATAIRTAFVVVVSAVAPLHAGFLVVEMFLWDKPLGGRVFGLSAEFARQSKRLAANQGLYNGFLAAGLAVGLRGGGKHGLPMILLFQLCVVIAGVFAAFTVSRRMLFAQALPALVGLLLWWQVFVQVSNE